MDTKKLEEIKQDLLRVAGHMPNRAEKSRARLLSAIAKLAVVIEKESTK